MDLQVRVISALRWSIIGRIVSQVATWSATYRGFRKVDCQNHK